jgi:hypothetical protein
VKSHTVRLSFHVSFNSKNRGTHFGNFSPALTSRLSELVTLWVLQARAVLGLAASGYCLAGPLPLAALHCGPPHRCSSWYRAVLWLVSSPVRTRACPFLAARTVALPFMALRPCRRCSDEDVCVLSVASVRVSPWSCRLCPSKTRSRRALVFLPLLSPTMAN